MKDKIFLILFAIVGSALSWALLVGFHKTQQSYSDFSFALVFSVIFFIVELEHFLRRRPLRFLKSVKANAFFTFMFFCVSGIALMYKVDLNLSLGDQISIAILNLANIVRLGSARNHK